MKILFDHPQPFLLAHGGFQIQIEQTKAGLESIGVDVEYLRWWDDRQHGDIIHYFGRPSSSYIQFARKKNIQVIIAPLLTGLGSRPKSARLFQKLIMLGFETVLPRMILAHFNWDSFRLAGACIALTSWESYLMSEIFRARPEKVHVVPNGVELCFLESAVETRGDWLVCTAAITERKRVFELAQAALKAGTPLWIIGKAYSDSDPYAQQFLALARKNPEVIRYEGAIHDRSELARIYRQARGFVLLSTMESLSLSALEAAACGCPLLLSDLPWARGTFGETASYCPVTCASATAPVLRKFYDDCPTLPAPSRPKTWAEIGEQLRNVYEIVLKTS
jgi:glycosyltransferase involved in cell wall biosynthesis